MARVSVGRSSVLVSDTPCLPEHHAEFAVYAMDQPEAQSRFHIELYPALLCFPYGMLRSCWGDKHMPKLRVLFFAACVVFTGALSNQSEAQIYPHTSGYFDMDVLQRSGNYYNGWFSQNIFEACRLSGPRSKVSATDLLVDRYNYRCDNGGRMPGNIAPIGVKVVKRFESQPQYIELSQGIPADCGAYSNLDAKNTHPSRPVRFNILWQRPSDGRILTYGPFTLVSGQVQRDILRCAWPVAWTENIQILRRRAAKR
jgi:hypothetical protein